MCERLPRIFEMVIPFFPGKPEVGPKVLVAKHLKNENAFLNGIQNVSPVEPYIMC